MITTQAHPLTTEPLAYLLTQDMGIPAWASAYQSALTWSQFASKRGEIKMVQAAPPIWFVGVGDTLTPASIRYAMGELARSVAHLPHLQVVLPECHHALVQAAVVGWVLGGYRVTHFSDTPKKEPLTELRLVADHPELTHWIDEATVMAQATCQARELAHMPANECTPRYISQYIATACSGLPIDIEVIDADRAKQLKMGAFCGVAQGSDEASCLVIMRYRPTAGAPIALVGKGVTFDSGGISIKPAKGMSDMKADMSGAAAIISTMVAVATMGLPLSVTGMVALTENMVSGRAQRPGDVVTAYNGKTIEIINTDAEGRLVLADALAYVIESDAPRMVVDMATLTGACSVALGEMACGILGTDATLIQSLIAAGDRVDERLWQLPLWDEYMDYLKSDSADMANASESGKAGTCTGAVFLKQFVGSTPWAHIDIASMMKTTQSAGHRVKGMSGVGVQVLIEWLRSQPLH